MAEKAKTTKTKTEAGEDKGLKFKGKYIASVGRRKTAVAEVRLYKSGTGLMAVNDEKIGDYFIADYINVITAPLKLAGLAKDFNVSALVCGGGKKAQAYAMRHGIARALVEHDEALKPGLKAKDYLTRDARKKERKKPGLRKARRAPQWAKR